MNEVKEKFLPLGTVCMLKNGTHPVMIIGYVPIPTNNNQTEMYDYTACMYPEGLLSTEQMLVFNHDQINNIIDMGFENQDSIDFRNKVKTLLNETKPNNTSTQ